MRVTILCGWLVLAAAGLRAQEFEAASVKPNKSGANSSSTNSDGELFRASNVPLRRLIVRAFGLHDYQVEGPDWMSTERYDISARYPPGLPQDPEAKRTARNAALRNMLIQRFGLATHTADRSRDVYGLMVMKSGIKMTPSAGDQGSNSNSTNGHYQASPVNMTTLADFVSQYTDLPVIDMTGLKGSFTFKLDWDPAAEKLGGKGADATDVQRGPSLTEAIEDQLGLTLANRKAPVQVLVVDRVEKVPTDN